MLTIEPLIEFIKTGLRGYKQAYISEKSGIDVAVISRLLAGKIQTPDYNTLHGLYHFIVQERSDRAVNDNVIDLRGE